MFWKVSLIFEKFWFLFCMFYVQFEIFLVYQKNAFVVCIDYSPQKLFHL
jgi:hypothetical protein